MFSPNVYPLSSDSAPDRTTDEEKQPYNSSSFSKLWLKFGLVLPKKQK